VPDWQYYGVSVEQVGGTDTRVCITVKQITNYNNCQTITGAVFTESGTNQMNVLNGMEGTIKEIDFYDSPYPLGDFENNYQTTGCAPFNGAACSVCSALTGVCYSTCNNDEYGAACTTCHANCIACFEAEANECFACATGINYDYATTHCNSCGDGARLEPAEECDDGNVDAFDGCDDLCVVEWGYTCVGFFPDVCSFSCIVGWNSGEKLCDDGDAATPHDGCNSAC